MSRPRRVLPPAPGGVESYEEKTSNGFVRVGRAAKSFREDQLPESAITASQFIGFFGHTQSGQRKLVTVLAGEGAPTVTGGWVKVASVARFQRVSFTVPEGYDPITMVIPVQFEGIALVKEAKNLEADIANLEWMAGRFPASGGAEVKGEPPYVEVFTVNSQGVQTPLVPLNYQGVAGRSQQWYMTNIAFDGAPWRDEAGKRIRQKATVTLTEIVSTPGSLKRNREAREEVKNSYYTVEATQAWNTIRKLAAAYGIPSAWEAIQRANGNINAEKELALFTLIKIPREAFRQVPR